ncbi:PREDICTED: lithostathine-1-alpha-like [Chrysochloris asiatica]|uniref:Lithostathine-1-alpha-like n=1 Tax=Chrysochloris asiatica TaxID=185453 RepID=A0A9B0U018_CHRAS|nr:PREDICTED: lithostathine-1-alpha-like [Chrysochloris asiatica]
MARANSCLILRSCLMFLSLSQGQEAQTELASAWIQCPEGTSVYGSYCYYFNHYQETWIDADLSCQNMPTGHLVSVLNQAEANFDASLIKQSSIDNCSMTPKRRVFCLFLSHIHRFVRRAESMMATAGARAVDLWYRTKPGKMEPQVVTKPATVST